MLAINSWESVISPPNQIQNVSWIISLETLNSETPVFQGTPTSASRPYAQQECSYGSEEIMGVRVPGSECACVNGPLWQ